MSEQCTARFGSQPIDRPNRQLFSNDQPRQAKDPQVWPKHCKKNEIAFLCIIASELHFAKLFLAENVNKNFL